MGFDYVSTLEHTRTKIADARGSERGAEDVGKAAVKTAKVQDLGAIAELQLPPGFSAASREKATSHGPSYSKEFVLPHAEARINISYRGKPLDADAAASFKSLLDKPDHKLNPEELRSVSDVLNTRGSEVNFKVNNAYTKSVDDRRVLFVEGEVPSKLKGAQKDELVMYIPADRKGSVIQEAVYSAPHDTFGAYVNAVKGSFENIELR